jgi:hypothetical protein
LSIPSTFFIAKPTDTHRQSTTLARGQNLTSPRHLPAEQDLKVKRADMVVLGPGFPTLVPSNEIRRCGRDAGRESPG